jgi:hypothetical protein
VSALNPSGIDVSEMPGSNAATRTRAEQVYANLVGLVSSASQTFNVTSVDSGFKAFAPFERRMKQNFVGAFGQDRWRVRKGLTATVGLRWEYHSVSEFTRGAALLPVGGAAGLWGATGVNKLFAPGSAGGQPTTLDFGGVSAWQEKYGLQGLVIIGPTNHSSQTSEEIRAFYAQHKLPWPVAIDARNRAQLDYGVSPIPHSFLIDRRGLVRLSHVGGGKLAEIEKRIEALLAERQ